MDVCPSPDQLRRFRYEELGDGAHQIIGTHVERCANCQEWLDQHPDGSAGEHGGILPVAYKRSGRHGPGLGPGLGSEGSRAEGFGETVSWPARDGSGAATVPDTIGKYKVLKPLGEGGQGQVFLVLHPALTHERVLKLAHRRLGQDPIIRDALLAEGKLLAQLEHPNLVRILDLDFDDDRPFLILDYVPGRNLQQHVETGRPSPRQAARWVAELAGVVTYLHERGIVHLDIKPKNILVDTANRPRLIDFGLARLRDAWSDDRGEPNGLTLAFAAPEQARGESDRIGPPADIFGLGGVLSYLLTGRAPFAGQDYDEVWARARRGHVDGTALRAAGVPRRLVRLILKALAAEPDRRYRTAADFERALRGWLRRRSVVVGMAMAVLAVAAGVYFVRFGSARTTNSAPPRGQTTLVTPKLAQPLHVESFEVRLYRGDPARLLGTIGKLSHAGRYDDNVRVLARLSGPAYYYLLALNPDGSVQFCPKVNVSTTPVATTEVVYPADADSYYGLTDGTGLQAFVLVASREPLPAFSSWQHRAAVPWKPTAEAAGAWRSDGRHFELLADPTRGIERKVASATPAALTDVCNALRDLPGVDAVEVIAFPVEP